jgi:hypothetical protein
MMERWYRDVYQDAIWDDTTLSTRARTVAVTYARHARDQADRRTPTADLSWVTYERLMQQTGIGTRRLISAAIRELLAAGWLVVVRAVSRRPTVYRLVVAGSSHGSSTTPGTTATAAGTPSVVAGTTSAGVDPTQEPPTTRPGTTVVPTPQPPRRAAGVGGSLGSSRVSGLPHPRSSPVGTQPHRPQRPHQGVSVGESLTAAHACTRETTDPPPPTTPTDPAPAHGAPRPALIDTRSPAVLEQLTALRATLRPGRGFGRWPPGHAPTANPHFRGWGTGPPGAQPDATPDEPARRSA